MKTQLLRSLKVVILLLLPTLMFAQAPPLGTAADFVIFTSVGAVTNVGTYKYLTHLTGNVGTNSGSSTNFGNVNGVMHDGDGASIQCASDVLFAYNSLGSAITDSTLGTVIGNGTTIRPGIFLMPGATSLNLDLTLNGQGNPNAVFIFKTPTAVAYAFTANPNAKIKLINGAQACNVFWQVSGAVNIGAGVAMKGNIVAHGAITMGAQDTLEGRALTVNGAITISNGALGFLAYTPIGCGSPVLIGPAAPTFVASGSYAVFATTGAASDCGTSRIIGDVGGNTVPPTGFNPDSVTGGIHFNDPSTNAAAADLLLVYNYLLGLPFDIKLLDPSEFGHNLVLTPHCYQMDAAVTFTDTLYLDAQGNADAVFVIKTFGAFETGSGAKVVLIHGTQAKNVYWFCTGAVSVGTNSIFKGAIIAHDAIDMLQGSKLTGRVFSTNGALTTCGMTASLPSPINTDPSNQTGCAGSSVSFSVSASGTGLAYQWRKGLVNLIDGGNISGATNDTLTINPVTISDAAPNYNVVVTGPSQPSYTSANASLTVNPLPAAIAGTNRAVCIGTSTTLGAASVLGSTYSWTSVPAGFVSILANPLVTPLVTTTYSVVEIVTATGCTKTNSVLVTVNPLPAAVAGANRAICLNTSTILGTASVTGSTYSWTSVPAGFISTLANPTVAPLVNTTYTIVETITASGCINSNSVVVTVNPLPAAVAGPDRAICLNTSTTLGASAVTGNTYSWTSVPLGFTSTVANPVVTPLVTTTYTVVETITATGCTNMHSVIVTINPLPVATSSNNGPICTGITLNLLGGPAGMTSYAWTGPNGFTSNIQNPSIANVTIAASGDYNLMATNSLGCLGSAVTTVVIHENPVTTAANNGPMCEGITLNFYGQPSGLASYAWTGPDGFTSTIQNPTIANVTAAATGQYILVGTNSYGCFTEASTSVTIYAKPVTTAANNGPLCTGTTLNLTGGPAGMISYAWTGPNGFTSNIQNPTIPNVTAVIAGVYSLNVTIEAGCSASANTTVVINPIPVAPTATQAGFVLTSSAPAGNQWYYNGNSIPGATDQTYTVTHNTGYYWVAVTINGCSSGISNKIWVEVVGVPEIQPSASFSIYPVPNNGRFTVSINYPVDDTFNIIVYNQIGELLFERRNVTTTAGEFETQIDIRPVANGMYLVVFMNSQNKVIKRFFVNN